MKADRLTPTPEELARIKHVLEHVGIWIVTDALHPGCEVPILSMGGQLHAMTSTHTLDPARFYRGVEFAGPFRSTPDERFRGALPVTLYFSTEAERVEFMTVMRTAKPGLKMEKLGT